MQKHDFRPPQEIVTSQHWGYPAAEAIRDETGEFWWILNTANGDVLSGGAFLTEEAAWQNALFELKKLNAWLLYKVEGEKDGNALGDWLDSERDLEDRSGI